jgi:type II secretory ATPase GspE/PulE/Tfp pilus assembly ATPase PilB-like protein
LTGDPCYNPEEAPGQTMFPDSLLEKHGVYPLFCGRRRVYLLSSKRSNYAFEDEWLSMGNEGIELVSVVSDAAAVNGAISRNRSRTSRGSDSKVDVGELYYSEDTNIVEIDPLEMSRLNPANPNNTPEQVIHWVLNRAMTLRASDLHIEKFYNTVRFRARIDGMMHVIHSASEEETPRYVALIKNYSNLGMERQRLQDARFAMKLGKRRIDVRVSAVPCRKDLQKITMRFLDKQDGIKTLTELNLSERQAKIVNNMMGRDQGLILVTGPTGSGKTTTLYAFLNSINDTGINIHTIEDPIEYEIEGINQTQTDPFNAISFATGLRALLRSDPDVMLIGETRDEETANAAINAALTGHLVLTTLHANDSLRAVSRILSMGIAPYLLADSLAVSQAQRLVRKLCSYCKRPVVVTQETQDFLHKQRVVTGPVDEPIYESVGCDECHGTGYSGRIALMEMCSFDAELADLVARHAPVGEMRARRRAVALPGRAAPGRRRADHLR